MRNSEVKTSSMLLKKLQLDFSEFKKHGNCSAI